jgi:nitroreductase
MDGVLQVIRDRRSVRRYTAEPVDDVTLEAVLEAAVWAPSAVNVQPWAFGIIRDRSLLEQYAERAKAICLADPPAAEVAVTPEPVLPPAHEPARHQTRARRALEHGCGTAHRRRAPGRTAARNTAEPAERALSALTVRRPSRPGAHP